MKQLNFSKLQHLLYTMTIILLVLLIFTCIIPIQASASSTEFNTKLMIIVEDYATKPTLNEEQENIIEIKNLSDISNNDNNHIAYAVSKSIAADIEVNSILKYAFKNLNARIYIYGELTISEFKNILDIDTYSVQTAIYNENGITDEKANMSFSEEQETNKKEQIICLSNNSAYQSLIVSAPYASLNTLETIIIGHYFDTYVNPLAYATIVKNSFNYRNYVYLSEDLVSNNCYLNTDYYLYKIEDEEVADYDYFAIRVNVSPVHDYHPTIGTNYPCTSFQVQLSLPYSSDHIYEYGPNSAYSANNINVSLGFSGTGISGSIGFNFSPGTGPALNTNYNPENRTVKWEASQFWFFGARLNDAIYPFGVTWASKGNLAAINISTYVVFDKSIHSNWNEIQVRYRY